MELSLEDLKKNLEDYQAKTLAEVGKVVSASGDKATEIKAALDAELVNVKQTLHAIEEQIKAAAAKHIPGLREEAAKKFSWTCAVRGMFMEKAHPGSGGAWKGAEIEKEMLDEMAKLRDGTAADVGSTGGYLITDEVSKEIIDMTIADMPIMSLGPTVLRGLVGDLPVPKKTGRAQGYMVSENGKPTQSNVTFGQFTLRPKKGAAFTKQSNRLIYQSRGVSDTLIKTDLSQAMALLMEQMILTGLGSESQPKGIFNHTGTTATKVALGANGGRFRLDDAALMLQDLDTADEYKANGNYGILLRPEAKWGMKREKVLQYSGQSANQGAPVLAMNLLMNDAVLNDQLGIKIASTTLIPKYTLGTTATASKVIAGNFAQLYIGMWRDLIVKVSDQAGDGSTGSAFLEDQMYIVCFQEFDCMLAREAAFTIAAGAETDVAKW